MSTIIPDSRNPISLPWYVMSTGARWAFLAATTMASFFTFCISLMMSVAGLSAGGQVLMGAIALGFLFGGPLALERAQKKKALWDTEELHRERAAAALEETRRIALWHHHLASLPYVIMAAAKDPLATIRRLIAAAGGTYSFGVRVSDGALSVAQRDTSSVAIGPSRCGKTTGIAQPAIMVAKGATVVISTKSDIMNKTAPVRKVEGRCWYLDLTATATAGSSAGNTRAFWSPLWGIENYGHSITTATNMVESTGVGQSASASESFWKDTAERYLGPLLFAAALHEDATMATVRQWVNDTDYDVPKAILASAAENPAQPFGHQARMALDDLEGNLSGIARNLDNARVTVLAVLNAYRLPDVRTDAHRQNFDPAAFVRSTETLYVIADATTQAITAPIVSCLLDALYLAARDLHEIDPFDASDRPPLLVVIDEAANVSPSQRIPQYLSEGPGQGFQMLLLFQSLAQAARTWPGVGRSLSELAANKVIFGGISDHETIEAFSAMTGDYDRLYTTHSSSETVGDSESTSSGRSFSWQANSSSTGKTRGKSSSSTFGESISSHKERNMTPGDISALGDHEALVVRRASWDKITTVSTKDPAWEHVFAQASRGVFLYPTPPQLSRNCIAMSTLEDLNKRAKAARAAELMDEMPALATGDQKSISSRKTEEGDDED